MLAYVLWHRRKEEFSKELYEEKLLRFHASLEASRVHGFTGSIVARISKVPWFDSSSVEGYEDWYLLDGSEVLDRLSELAVTDSRKDSHDAIAHLATDFRGGLYQLKEGDAFILSISGNFVSWLSKPPGTSYETFYSDISKYLPKEKSSLWRRQMTLGPTPEFCMITSSGVDLPPKFNSIVVNRKIIWRGREA